MTADVPTDDLNSNEPSAQTATVEVDCNGRTVASIGVVVGHIGSKLMHAELQTLMVQTNVASLLA